MAARRMLATIIMGSLLALTAPAGAVAAAPAARLPRLMIGDVVVSEGDSPGELRPAVLPVTLSEPVATPVTF
ncbi:MAG TPA: hypothetical protein VH479_07040, partial [Acidimicrobiales bacterium]